MWAADTHRDLCLFYENNCCEIILSLSESFISGVCWGTSHTATKIQSLMTAFPSFTKINRSGSTSFFFSLLPVNNHYIHISWVLASVWIQAPRWSLKWCFLHLITAHFAMWKPRHVSKQIHTITVTNSRHISDEGKSRTEVSKDQGDVVNISLLMWLLSARLRFVQCEASPTLTKTKKIPQTSCLWNSGACSRPSAPILHISHVAMLYTSHCAKVESPRPLLANSTVQSDLKPSLS